MLRAAEAAGFQRQSDGQTVVLALESGELSDA